MCIWPKHASYTPLYILSRVVIVIYVRGCRATLFMCAIVTFWLNWCQFFTSFQRHNTTHTDQWSWWFRILWPNANTYCALFVGISIAYFDKRTQFLYIVVCASLLFYYGIVIGGVRLNCVLGLSYTYSISHYSMCLCCIGGEFKIQCEYAIKWKLVLVMWYCCCCCSIV